MDSNQVPMERKPTPQPLNQDKLVVTLMRSVIYIKRKLVKYKNNTKLKK